MSLTLCQRQIKREWQLHVLQLPEHLGLVMGLFPENGRPLSLVKMGAVCRDCSWLSVTETEQDRLHELNPGIPRAPHVCIKYDARLEHGFAEQHEKGLLASCAECRRAEEDAHDGC